MTSSKKSKVSSAFAAVRDDAEVARAVRMSSVSKSTTPFAVPSYCIFSWVPNQEAVTAMGYSLRWPGTMIPSLLTWKVRSCLSSRAASSFSISTARGLRSEPL